MPASVAAPAPRDPSPPPRGSQCARLLPLRRLRPASLAALSSSASSSASESSVRAGKGAGGGGRRRHRRRRRLLPLHRADAQLTALAALTQLLVLLTAWLHRIIKVTIAIVLARCCGAVCDSCPFAVARLLAVLLGCEPYLLLSLGLEGVAQVAGRVGGTGTGGRGEQRTADPPTAMNLSQSAKSADTFHCRQHPIQSSCTPPAHLLTPAAGMPPSHPA